MLWENYKLALMNNIEDHLNSSKPVLVDFFAEWCGPCKLILPVLHQVMEHFGDKVTILKVDIDKSPCYIELFKIQAVPTLVVFKNGKVTWRKSGLATTQEILHHLEGVIFQ